MKIRDRGFVPLVITQAASNVCTSTNTFIAIWLLSTPSLPTLLLGVNQGVFLATLMLGTRLNPLVVNWLGLRRSTLLLLLLEGLGLAGLGVWIAGQATPEPSFHDAVGIVVLAGITTFAGGLNGPSWVTVVARWGGDPAGRSRRLMADSAAFQFAAAVGPLVGSIFVSSASLLWLLPCLNMATNAAAAAVVGWGTRRYPLTAAKLPEESQCAKASPTRANADDTWKPNQGGLLISVRSLPLITLLVLAAFADPVRTVLPLIVREAGGAAGTLASTSAALAVAAALATALASDSAWAIRISHWMRAGGTFLVLSLGTLAWLLGGSIVAFIAGALLLGLGSATLYGQLMAAASEADQAEGRETRYVADAILLRALISSLFAFILTSGWGDAARTATIVGASALSVMGVYAVGRSIQRRLTS
ncbi:hypothetical protein [Paenarthrobacter nitroguajacolicus]|uniref:hypothetical protein n=1 Tax=Paenarthrobacter nitroguajacolicus TaxID=211146 RepID=UPI0015BF1FAF|nr:hypothetical protein [Paenarthrobacter nitroguajacolicus]NWL34539.1 hypothetical protein [Paenarthrobacter nitroguajacolicus]